MCWVLLNLATFWESFQVLPSERLSDVVDANPRVIQLIRSTSAPPVAGELFQMLISAQ